MLLIDLFNNILLMKLLFRCVGHKECTFNTFKIKLFLLLVVIIVFSLYIFIITCVSLYFYDCILSKIELI